jgi:hypothetical protein
MNWAVYAGLDKEIASPKNTFMLDNIFLMFFYNFAT